MNFLYLRSARKHASESDPASQSPSQAMAADIFQLNTSVAAFRHLVNDIGTSKDNPDLLYKLDNIAPDIMRLAKDTFDKLLLFYGWPLDPNTSVSLTRSQEIEGCKLAKDFQAALQEFNNALQLASKPPPSEVTVPQSLSEAVVANIVQINTAVSTYRRVVEAIGTSQDSPYHRQKLHKIKHDILQLVKDTSVKVKELKQSVAMAGDSKKKYPLIKTPVALLNNISQWWKSKDHAADVSKSENIEGLKLAKDFQAAVKEFRQVQQLASKRESAYMLSLPAHAAAATSASEETEQDIEDQPFLLMRKRQEIMLSGNEITLGEPIIQECGLNFKVIENQVQQIYELVDYFIDVSILVRQQTVHDDIYAEFVASVPVTSHSKLQFHRCSWYWLLIVAAIILIIVLLLVVIM